LRRFSLIGAPAFAPNIGRLTDKESAFAATVDGVDRPEFLQPYGSAKFAENRSVQVHPIYFTSDINIIPRIGIENIEDGIISFVDTYRLWAAEVRKCGS
jgi:hypothetical protein